MKLLLGLALILASSSADARGLKEPPLAATEMLRIEQILREARDSHNISEQLYEQNISFVHDNQCETISRTFTRTEQARWSSIVSANRHIAGAKAVESFVSSSWRIVYASVYIDKTGPCQSADDCLKEALKNPLYQNAQETKILEDRQFKVAYFYLNKP